MKTIYKIASVFFIAASIISCESYFDVNTDPNNPLVSTTTPDIILPGAMTTTGTTLVSQMNRLGNLMTGNWGGNVINFSGPFDSEFRYDVTSSFYDGVWNNLMARTANYTNIINYSSTDVNYNNHKAVSYIMRAFYTQYLVDLYGDQPYSERHLGTAGLNPSYDNAQDIYRALVTDLNMAISMINDPANADALALGASNVMQLNGTLGNMSMNDWKAFANTVKLRVLLRQSEMTDAATQAHITSELNGLSTADFLSDNLTLNPGYSNDSGNGRQNPFYATFGFETNGSFANTNNTLVAPTTYAVELLDGTLNGVNDPRLTRLWTNDGNPNAFQGIAQGDLLGNLPLGGSTILSRLGAGLGVDVPSDAGATQAAYIMTAAESYFLQAEAIERGYITGSAQGSFDNGVNASMALLGATDGGYLVAANATNGIGYTASGNKIEAIIYQKYVALTNINGIEGWIEYSRTGFPSNLPLSLTATTATRPVKLLYPVSELSGNSANVPSQSTSDAFTSKIFWDVN